MRHRLFLTKFANTEVGDIAAPYGPDAPYPETRAGDVCPGNYVYKAVRDTLRLARLDAEHEGTAAWNPLGALIHPGQTVLLKPNLVLHRSNKPGEHYHSVVTHPAIIRAVLDYVYMALNGEGRIIIGDAPLNNCRFDVLCDSMGLRHMQQLYASNRCAVELRDFRQYVMEKDAHGVIRVVKDVKQSDDYRIVDFGAGSLHAEHQHQYRRYRVTEYDGDAMPRNHNLTRHAYCVHRSVLDADVVISLPKIKTHHKAGITCAMKNVIGINGSKDWLPHHTRGSADEGGDEYLHKSVRKRIIGDLWDIRWRTHDVRMQRAFLAVERFLWSTHRRLPFKDRFAEGSWWGNRTISRTIGDLNRALLYADRDGALQPTAQRRALYFVDGVICGEGDGPMGATSKRCNMILLGDNAFAIDLLVSRLMGFDFRKMDTFTALARVNEHPVFSDTVDDVDVVSNLHSQPVPLADIRQHLAFTFVPASGWLGAIELEPESEPRDTAELCVSPF
jgi:uncharacterized protein (DUF362 family)